MAVEPDGTTAQPTVVVPTEANRENDPSCDGAGERTSTNDTANGVDAEIEHL